MKYLKAGHHKLIFGFLVLLTIGFGLLSIWAYIPGESVFAKTYTDRQLQAEEPTASHGSFTLEKRQVVQLNVSSPQLDNSWVWVKTVILDEKDRPVADYSFNLEYYSGYQSGEHWSEGDHDSYAVFTLPAGTYKILAYAEDPKRRTTWTRPTTERVHLEVVKGVVLARYFIAGGILFALLSFLYLKFAGWATRRRVRRVLLDLAPSDKLEWQGEQYDVDGKLRYEEQTWWWVDFALLGDTEVLWLSIDGESEEVTMWREVRDIQVDEVPPPFNIHYEGDTYTQVESGRADVTRKGAANSDRKQGMAMQYFDYEGPRGQMLSVEVWEDEVEVSVGRELSPYELTRIRPDSD